MASGSFSINRTGSTSQYIVMWANWSSTSNIEGNYSDVSVSVYAKRDAPRNQYHTWGTASTTVSLDGQSQNEPAIAYDLYGGDQVLLFAKAYRVWHNQDGSKQITISANVGGASSSIYGNGNDTVWLDPIPRTSGVSCTNANIGSNATITISRHSSSFTHTLTYQFGSLSGTIATKTSSTSVSWTLPDSFYTQIPNSNEGTGTIYCTTYNGNTSIGTSSCGFRAYVTNANPDTTNLLLEVYDSNSTTIALTGNADILVKGYSTLHVRKHTDAVAQKSATMREYKLENVTQAYSTGIQDFEIAKYNKNNFTFYSTDSRGNSTATQTIFPWFVDYFDITKGSISLTRNQGGVGEEVTLNFNGALWNGNFGDFQDLTTTGVDNIDNLTTIYRYKKTTDTQWTTGTTTINPTLNGNSYSYSGLIAGDTQTHGFDIDDSYDFEVTISDSLSTVIFSTILGTGKPAIAVYGNKVALGDKYDTSLGGIQLWGDIYVNGNRIS